MSLGLRNVDLRDDRLTLPTARDVAALLFRRKRLLVSSFFVLFLFGTFLMVQAPKYAAQMKILVRRDRADPMITSQTNAPPQFDRDQVSEEDLNSEVELLRSEDLLKKVVLSIGLENEEAAHFKTGREAEELRVAKAVRRLSRNIIVKPIQKTNMMAVSYGSSDPDRAEQVLARVAELYLAKHLEVHRPSGEFSFFDQQTSNSRKQLEDAEAELSDFINHNNSVAAEQERDLTLEKTSEFRASTEQTHADISQAQQRMRTLERLQNSTPARIATMVKEGDNPQLLQTMKSTLLNLKLKRAEMLAKYAPAYKPVRDVEKEIADTQAAIAAESANPVKEQTTDQNPVYAWIVSEKAKTATDLSGFEGKAQAHAQTLGSYEKRGRELERASVEQGHLLRNVKVADDNYLLYVKKREEARISDALDLKGILNVAVAEQPNVPILPVWPLWELVVIAFLGAAATSVGVAFTADVLNPSLQTPDELAGLLGSPVLAAIPTQNRTMFLNSPRHPE